MSWQYDVFISYRREGRSGEWVREVLHPELMRVLPDYLPHEPRIFRDETSVEPGQRWPEAIANAFHRSKVVLCVVCPPFFRSGYCLSELEAVRSRIALLERSGAAAPHRCLYALKFADGEWFEHELREGWDDYEEFSNLSRNFASSPRYLGLRDRLVELARALAPRLCEPPEWSETWTEVPVVLPDRAYKTPKAVLR